MAYRAFTADRRTAAKAIAASRVNAPEFALNTLILVVTLVLLSGAVWTHAT